MKRPRLIQHGSSEGFALPTVRIASALALRLLGVSRFDHRMISRLSICELALPWASSNSAYMIARDDSETPLSGDRVHLERCKICGEWINRLNLEQVLQHLDHSRVPTAVLSTGAVLGSAGAAS